MLSQFNYFFSEETQNWVRITTTQAVAISASVLLVAFLFRVHQLLRPVDRLRAPPGKKWKLPPGPRGLPYLGNLLLYNKGEEAVSYIKCPFAVRTALMILTFPFLVGTGSRNCSLW